MSREYEEAKRRFYERIGEEERIVRLLIETEIAIVRESTAYDVPVPEIVQLLKAARGKMGELGRVPPIRVQIPPGYSLQEVVERSRHTMPLKPKDERNITREFRDHIGDALQILTLIMDRRSLVFGEKKVNKYLDKKRGVLRMRVAAVCAEWLLKKMDKHLLYFGAGILHYQGYCDFSKQGLAPNAVFPQSLSSTSKICRKFQRIRDEAVKDFERDKTGILKQVLTGENRRWYLKYRSLHGFGAKK